MAHHRYKDKFVKKDAWVKSLFKTYDPKTLADLIQKRIQSPSVTGPAIIAYDKEISTDIINYYIAHETADFRNKIEPAVGLLLYQLLHNEIKEDEHLFYGICEIIRDSKLVGCRMLLNKWLNQAKPYLLTKEKSKKNMYVNGMLAYAKIQEKHNPEMEHFWINIWKEGQSTYWDTAFYGLRLCSPKLACQELPLFVKRKIEKFEEKGFLDHGTPSILAGMWQDEETRSQLETFLKEGINSNAGWAGYITNILVDKFNDENKTKFLSSLK